MKIGTAERLPVDSDLSATAYSEALRILKPAKPVESELGCVDLVLAFGPGCWPAAHEIREQVDRTAGIVLQLVFNWEDYEESEWLLLDRTSGRSVWTPGAGSAIKLDGD